ncbi:MAG TPA: lysophospholipid acyltransferase family protein [Casimicrobiaceae bacterium]|nr:lysophospholipid acyltransferase family protein [Casimicrobiaceae bacterium]
MHVGAGVATTLFVFPLVSATRRRALVKRWSRQLLRILAVEPRVHGELGTRDGNVMVVANHISWLDIFVLNSVHPVRFVAKSELAAWPIVGAMIRGAGTLFVERAVRRDTHRVNDRVAKVLADGDVVAIFPEGTTTDGLDMLPFKSSLLQPIVDAQGHVQPVAIRYRTPDGSLSVAPAYVGDTTFAESFWEVCGARALIVELIATAALPARDSHRRMLARDAEFSIRTALAAPAVAKAPGTPGGHRA